MMSRLIVLPFRVLRPDPETDFLGFSLPGRHCQLVIRPPIVDRALKPGGGSLRGRGSESADDSGRSAM